MTEILNERGRAKADGASLLAAERDWRERRRERGRARAGGASLLAAERDWRERGICDDTFAVAVDLTHLKTKHARASQKFDGRTRCAPENEW
jgi:hypothetical protein